MWEMGWPVLGLRPAVENDARSDSKEVWQQDPKSECPPRTPVAEISDRNGGACAHEGLDRGRSSQSVGVAVAAVDEHLGELLKRASVLASEQQTSPAAERPSRTYGRGCGLPMRPRLSDVFARSLPSLLHS